MWNEPTEAKARSDVLKNCRDGKEGRCRIISCRAGVDTQEQAHAIWPTNNVVDGCFGNKDACELGRHADR